MLIKTILGGRGGSGWGVDVSATEAFSFLVGSKPESTQGITASEFTKLKDSYKTRKPRTFFGAIQEDRNGDNNIRNAARFRLDILGDPFDFKLLSDVREPVKAIVIWGNNDQDYPEK